VQRRKTEIKKLERELKKAEKRPKTLKAEEKPLKTEEKRVVEKAKVQEAQGNDLPEVEPYRFSKLRPRHLFSRYSAEHRDRYLKQYHSEARRLLPSLVRIEGPIHVEHAFKRMNKAFRLRRATQAFNEAFREEVKRLGRRGAIRVKGDFIWPKSGGAVKVRVPVEGVRESFRPIEYIPMEEITRAMTLVAGHSLGLSERSLLNETARLLGFKRIGENIDGALREAFKRLRKEGILVQADNLIVFNKRGRGGR